MNALPLTRARKDLPLTRLLPNMLTMLSLCSGLTGVRFAILGQFHEALLAVVIAAVFDVLDGRVARMLNIVSKLGAELDSLSDAISFGVAPGLIIYEWTLKGGSGFGWIAVLFYAACTALRLARFNTMLDDQSVPAWAKSFFTGVPAPGGAGLALLPLMVALEFGDNIRLPDVVVAFWLILVGGLMISRLPTMSLKGLRVGHIWVAPIFVFVLLMVAAVIVYPWLVFAMIGIIYLSSLPLGWYIYRRRQTREGLISHEAG